MAVADLMVLDRDLPEVQLVVDVKPSNVLNYGEAQQQLKAYMLARSCPLGLLVTPSTTWLLRDTYDGTGEAAIQVSGEYPTSDLLDLDEVPESEHELSARIHDWLESLAASGQAQHSRASAREDVARWLLPAVVEGRVFTEAHL